MISKCLLLVRWQKMIPLDLTQKAFRFFAPCSSEYQTTPFQRPSVRLKMFPFVSNFRCISSALFSATHNTTPSCG